MFLHDNTYIIIPKMKKNNYKMNKEDKFSNVEPATPTPVIDQEVPDGVDVADTLTGEDATVDEDVLGVSPEEGDELEALKNMLQERDNQLEKEKNEYLFLMAEFDNFKKRTIRERADLLKNAAEKVLKGILPIVDDFERGLAAIKDSSDAESVKEGMELIYNKLIKYLNQNGVKAIETTGQTFDPDVHEAIAMLPVDDESKKGKIVDTVEKGYMLNDKVLRHPKVAVGQ